MESIYFLSILHVDSGWGIFNLEVLAAWAKTVWTCAACDPTVMEATCPICEGGYLLSWGVVNPRGVNGDLK